MSRRQRHQQHILFIDAYDSFANNVVGLLEKSLGAKVTTIHHDSPHVTKSPQTFKSLLRNFDAVVIGPGPGHPGKPEDIGVIRQLWDLDDGDLLPIFGVCLGFQSLGLAHGATVERLPKPRHGIVTRVAHQNTDIFTGTGEAFYATNYHSLRVHLPPAGAAPSPLVPLAWDRDDPRNGDILLGMRHATKPFWGVQFHPESECTTAASAQLMMANWWAQANAWNNSLRSRRPRDRTHSAEQVTSILAGHHHRPGAAPVITDLPLKLEEKIPSPFTMQAALSGSSSSASSDDGKTDITQATEVDVQPTLTWKTLSSTKVPPPQLYEALREATGTAPIMLDSQDHPRGRFSIMGLVDPEQSPRIIYSVAKGPGGGGDLYYGTTASSTTKHLPSISQVWPLLQEKLNQSKPSNDDLPSEIPFWGGWMGYLTYEAGLETIDVPLHDSLETGAADINMVFVSRSIVVDHLLGTIHIQTLLSEDTTWLEETSSLITKLSSETYSPQWDAALEDHLSASTLTRPTGDSYRTKVELCQDVLSAGDSYELCLTDESNLVAPSSLNPWQLYKKLRKRNTAPFGAFLDLSPLQSREIGGVTVVGSSPERFLHWSRQGHLEFRPIKGTVKKAPGVTREIAHEILNSSKEQAENLMIVDLIRHDLSGVVGSANTKVSQLMVIEEYETVYQLVSAIEGQIPPESKATGLDVLSVSLPPGSMTGAPKKRSCEVLVEMEKRARGVYSGVLGYMDVGGGGDFSVVIRTAFRNHHDGVSKEKETGTWRVGAGGAVTIQSTAEGEFLEMETKAGSVLGAMVTSL